jgi:hypothetical protein
VTLALFKKGRMVMKASIRELSAQELDFVSAGHGGYSQHKHAKRDDDDRDDHKRHGHKKFGHKDRDDDHDDDRKGKHRYC